MMNLAKVSANGQITVPAEIRRLLGLGPGDKVLFTENSVGEIVISNAAGPVSPDAQQHVAAGPAADPDPIQRLIDELRGTAPS